MNEQLFVQSLFRQFYSKNFLDFVPEIGKREFGIGEFGKKISLRHLAFRNARELNLFLGEQSPFFVSFSAAYYSFPAVKPMQAKELLKADLVYEFDADDLKMDCAQLHDSWKCRCGAVGKGSISNCTSCGQSVVVDQWVCPECLEGTKKQVFGLVKILENELGITGGFFFNFSGFKGFHVHVRNEAFLGLSARARVELVDYLTGAYLEPSMHGFFYSGKRFFAPKPLYAFGWSKRILDRLKGFFSGFDAVHLSSVSGVSVSFAKKVLLEKQKFLDSIDSGELLALPLNKTEKFWQSLVLEAVALEKIVLDRQTSVDLSKILRLPGSLHGLTGLSARHVFFDELKNFSPLNESIVFSDQNTIRLKSVIAPKFYLGSKWWGPFKGEETELPEFVAVYLLCRQKAFLA